MVLKLLLIMSLPLSFACDIDGKSGIVEENDLYIGVNDKMANSMTKEKFMEVIDKIKEIYTPIVKEQGGDLQINALWDNGTVNAYAQRSGNTWLVSMFGGLARHEAITPGGLALVVCHELGHHIGGAPKKKTFIFTTWASNEGQSDYFGNLKCMRRFYEGEDHKAELAKLEVPDFVKEKCDKNYSNEDDQLLCQRTSMAGKSLGNLFKVLRKLTKELKFSTPDPKKVTKTFHGHPEPQCRLDTYFEGALCDKRVSEAVDQKDVLAGTCNRSTSHTEGVRPLCWYLPKK